MNQSNVQAERRAKRVWVSLVILLLGLQVCVGYTAIRLATGDPSVAIVPDYHTAALHWDQRHAALLAAARLGWKIDCDISRVADASGERTIAVDLKLPLNQSIGELEISAQVYHHARANQVQTVRLQDVADGRFMARIQMSQPGLWQLELDITGASEPIQLTRSFSLE